MDMDKEDGLAITKEQAQSMLPVVQASITAAELTDADKSKLLLPLTDAQKKFIDNAAARMSERRESNANGEGVKPRKNGDAPKPADKPQKNANDQHAAKDGGGDGKDKDAGQAPKNGGAKGDSEKKQGDAAGKPPGDGQGNNGMGPRWRDGGQQLIELLQSKLK
jgi:hypothetical protein